MFYYGIISAITISYTFMMAIMNSVQELNIFPPYEYCLMSENIVDPTKLFLYFFFPIVITFIVTLLFDFNIWQRPYSTHVNIKDIYSAVFAQTSIRSSVLIFLFMMTTWPCIAKDYFNCELSLHVEGLLISSLHTPLLIIKGPCLGIWTHQTEKKNLKDARHNMDMELKNIPPQMEGTDGSDEGEDKEKSG